MGATSGLDVCRVVAELSRVAGDDALLHGDLAAALRQPADADADHDLLPPLGRRVVLGYPGVIVSLADVHDRVAVDDAADRAAQQSRSQQNR